LLAVAHAAQLQTSSQARRNELPGNISPEVLFQLGDVITGLDDGASLEPLLERLFGRRDLGLQLRQATAKRQQPCEFDL
jgi:hypothetical protein